MSWVALSILLGVPFFLFLSHAAVGRIFPLGEGSPWLRLLYLSLITGAATVAILWVLPQTVHSLGSLFFFILVTGNLIHVYFHFFNMSETARRIRIVVALKVGLNVYAMAQGHGQFVPVRLKRWVKAGQLDCVDGRYYLRSRWLRFVVFVFETYRRVLFSDPVHVPASSRRAFTH